MQSAQIIACANNLSEIGQALQMYLNDNQLVTFWRAENINIGGMDFFVDTWVRPKDAPTRADSDREHVQALIRAKGYKMPAGMMDVRLVHLLDESKRKELMIIYGEDLASTGLTAADLQEGGKAHDRWPAIEKGLIERAQQKIAIK